MIAAHTPRISSTVPADGPLRIWSSQPFKRSAAAVDWLHHTLCGLRGHAMTLHFESTRLSLQCMSCGHTTPGWAIADRH